MPPGQPNWLRKDNITGPYRRWTLLAWPREPKPLKRKLRGNTHQKTVPLRDRRPGCLSIKVERADPSGIMTYSEADPEADMLNVFVSPEHIFSIPNVTQNA